MVSWNNEHYKQTYLLRLQINLINAFSCNFLGEGEVYYIISTLFPGKKTIFTKN